MAEICNPGCNDSQIRTYAIPCARQTSTRKGGFDRFVLLDCDVNMTDFTDITEWQALQAAQRYIYSPPGFGKMIKPETKKEQLSACAPEEVIDEISGVEWSTKLFDNTSYCDFNFEYDVKNLYGSKNLIWLGCDGLLYTRYNWVSGENPGYGGLSADVWREGDAGALQSLHIDIKFNTYQIGTLGTPIDQALIDVIFSDSYIISGGCGI